MTNSPISSETTEKFDDTLGSVAKSLRETSERAQGLSADAREVLSTATTELLRIAEKLRKQAIVTAKDTAQDIRAHPMVAIAGAIAAVATLAGIFAATRRHGSASF